MPAGPSDRILLGHGGGGTLTAQLIDEIFVPILGGATLRELDDAAVLAAPEQRLAFSTDSFVVTPLFFPGGDIGQLAVHGTVNDLAMKGARPLFLSVGFIIEEGLEIATLERVCRSMAAAARASGVEIVTGDTKVVGRGSGDQLFINTSGIGSVPPGRDLGARAVRPGDAVLVSGELGDHGVTIMAAREELGIEAGIESDTAPLYELVQVLLEACSGTRALRDPTRGGVAATWYEMASSAGVGIEIDEESLPVNEGVRGVCEILGLDPLVVANEGKFVAIVDETQSERAVAALRQHPLGRSAARVGRVTAEHPGRVLLRTGIGAARVLERPWGELLPRIC